MLNYFDKAGLTLIAGGVLGQFFTSLDTNVRGCTAEHNATGVWTITLPSPISRPNYIFTFGALTGFGPGLTVSCSDLTTTTKQLQIKNTNTGASVDADVSFLFLEIPPPT